jgi:hypothetical protein
MIVTYRDEIGMVEIIVDEYDIGFVDGYAFFSSDEKDYKIAIDSIVCISKVKE